MSTARKTPQTRRGQHLLLSALAAACLLLGGVRVDAQAQLETIIVTSPTSDEIVHAGEAVMVEFDTIGEAVTGFYDVDLFKGNNQVGGYCSESEGCAIFNGSVSVNISSTSEPGVGYTVKVTDRTSSTFGWSPVFEVLATLPSNSSAVGAPQYEDEIGGAGGVGDMSLAMFIVAAVCGIALVATVLAASCVVFRRRKQSKSKDVETAGGDLEHGGGPEHGGFSVGNPLKVQESRSIVGSSQRSIVAASPARRGERAVPVVFPSPGRAMLMGDQQRGRSLLRESPARQMYRSSPGGSSKYGYDGSGGGVFATTPGVSSSGSGCPRTPQRSSSTNLGRGPQMYDRSRTPARWDEAGPRRTSRSPRRDGFAARPKSVGRMRRPTVSMVQGGFSPAEASGGYSGRTTITPGRRRSTSRDSRDDGPQEHLPVGIRRSKSAKGGLRRSMSEHHEYDPSQDWARQEEEEEEEGARARWEDRGIMAAVGKIEGGRRGHRSPRTSLARSGSTPNLDMSDTSERYDRERRERSSKSTTPSRQAENNSERPPDVSWEELRSIHIKNKARARGRKLYALPSYGDAVRAENDADDDSRPPPPCYSPHDADIARRLSIGIPDYPDPGSFRAIKSAKAARPGMMSGARRGARTPGGLSTKSFDRGLSPGTRAVNARKAARNAQQSAEKALAAAAMASRAADLAAQAALEAEVEAEMGHTGDDDDSCTEVEMSPPSKASPCGEVENSLVRQQIKVFSGGSGGGSSMGSGDKVSPASAGKRAPGRSPYTGALSRSWSQADENEVKARADVSSARAKEALAYFGRSSSGGGGGGSRPDRSWVKSGVKGPDTAGGSSTEGGRSVGGEQNGAAAAATSTAAAPAPLSSKQRRVFVKQYSQSGTSDYEGDSDYSLHDNAAATAIAATFDGPDMMANGRNIVVTKRLSPVSTNDASNEAYSSSRVEDSSMWNMSDSESPHVGLK